MERALIDTYRASIEAALSHLTSDNLALAIELASLPERIRGFGHVKLAHVNDVRTRWQALEQALSRTSAIASPRQAA